MSAPQPSAGRNYWPVGITATLAVFLAGTVVLVVLSARNNVELVSPDYYERELRFQQQINNRSRTLSLAEPVRVTYEAGPRQLALKLPAAHAAAATGEIELYRPSSAGQDRRMALQLDAQGRQTLDAAGLAEGLWRVRVTWRVDGEHFAFDEKVIIAAR